MWKYLLLLVTVGVCVAKKRSHTDLYNGLIRGYEKDAPPSEFTGRAAVVKFGLYIHSVELDTENQELITHAYVRQTWSDERLRFPDDEQREMLGCDGRKLKDIWVPDTFMRNSIEKQRSDKESLLRIYKDGKIWFAEKVKLRLACAMHLQKFPFDVQECGMRVESFKYTVDDVILKFLDDREPLEMAEEMSVQGFTISNTTLSDCTLAYTTGTYPCLEFQLLMKREYGQQFRHMFIPCVILLIFIYLSTWMGNQILLPRTLILIVSTLLLGVNIIACSLLLEHPRVDYLTAGDLWYPIIVVLLMIAILEFALVAKLTNHADGTPESSDSKYVRCGACIEWIFRIAFLVIILIFFAGYFLLYML